MSSWGEFRSAEPEFAAAVLERFMSGRHRTIATLRADGAPRISGIECEFVDDQLLLGSMSAARKLADLTRDPRLALHSPAVDPVPGDEAAWPGEAKISGRGVRVGAIEADGAPVGDQFRVEIESAVLTRINSSATAIVVEWWTPTGGLRRVERA